MKLTYYIAAILGVACGSSNAQFTPEMLNGILGGGAAKCEFNCPSGSKPEPNPKHVATANGCGTEFARIETEYLETLTPCCNWHDKCFSSCGKAFAHCEKGFKACISKKCAKLESKTQVDSCNKEGQLFSMMTGLMGCPLWMESQREACLCDGNTLPKSAVRDDSKFANGADLEKEL